MAAPETFATLQDLETRYPAELITLAADESTGLRDDARIEAVLRDVTVEARAILLARYSRADLDRLDDEARDVLRVYAIAMALYRVALSFSRSSERLKEGYDNAVKALQGIAAGKGKLGLIGDSSAAEPLPPGSDGANNGNVLVESAERQFTRERLRGM
ncbi:phage protein Gp36 family protein [Methylorubrum zatmanii]